MRRYIFIGVPSQCTSQEGLAEGAVARGPIARAVLHGPARARVRRPRGRDEHRRGGRGVRVLGVVGAAADVAVARAKQRAARSPRPSASRQGAAQAARPRNRDGGRFTHQLFSRKSLGTGKGSRAEKGTTANRVTPRCRPPNPLPRRRKPARGRRVTQSRGTAPRTRGSKATGVPGRDRLGRWAFFSGCGEAAAPARPGRAGSPRRARGFG